MDKPSDRTIRRVKKRPQNSNVKTLYALAESKKQSMEQLAKLPLYLAGRRIDGYIIENDRIWTYSKDIPQVPPSRALYLFLTDSNEYLIAKRRQVKTYKQCIGIITLEIRLTMVEKDDDIRAIENKRDKVEWVDGSTEKAV